MHINPNKSGITLGLVCGGSHALWAVLVALGFAGTVLDFIYQLHFLRPNYAVASFNVVTAIELVVVTGLVGYALGYVFGIVWNKIQA